LVYLCPEKLEDKDWILLNWWCLCYASELHKGCLLLCLASAHYSKQN